MLNNNTPTRLGKQEIACEKTKAQPKCNSLICTGLRQICCSLSWVIRNHIDRLQCFNRIIIKQNTHSIYFL